MPLTKKVLRINAWNYNGKFIQSCGHSPRYHVILFSRGEAVGRPTEQECRKRLRLAFDLFKAGKWSPANPAKLLANWEELESDFSVEVTTSDDQRLILESVFKEVKPSDYVGSHPPELSYEQKTKRQDLFEFRWHSLTFGGACMYFKFSISRGGSDQRLYIYSLHPNREREQ